MDQKVEEEEEWEQCLVAEARVIDATISINLERDWIEDSQYNVVNHMEKQEIYVIRMNQESFKDVHSGNIIATIEEIKENRS